MKRIIINFISGVGSLLDISGEYDDAELESKTKLQSSDSENIHNDFVKVGDYINNSFRSELDKNQLGFDFNNKSKREPLMQK